MEKIKLKNSKKDFVWYILGSVCNAATSAILMIITLYLKGTIEAGMITISFTIAQQILIIGRFEVRSYQITDVENKYTFYEYFIHRIIFCGMMLFFSVIYIASKNYEKEKCMIIFLLCIYKMTEAFSDVFQGQFQKQGNLAGAGKTMMWREAIFMLVYSITLWISSNLIIACFFAVGSAMIWIILFDGRYIKKYDRTISYPKLFSLTKECLPIFISVFMNTYLINASKYMIDQYAGDQMQSYYNMLFLPVSIINLFSIIIFFPMMTELADLWNKKMYEKVMIMIKRTIGIISILSGIIILLGAILGIPFLTFLYGIELTEFKSSFVILLLGGWCTALSGFLNRILILLRKQNLLIFIYLLVAIGERVLAQNLVRRWELLGAACAYFLGMLLLVVLMLGVMEHIRRKVKKNENRIINHIFF
jgi:O-antigen/teichoic acid export membrane protein